MKNNELSNKDQLINIILSEYKELRIELKAYISKNKTSINFNKILDLELKNELFLTNKKLHEMQSNLK